MNEQAKTIDAEHIDVRLDDMDKYWLLYNQHYEETPAMCTLVHTNGKRCETDKMSEIRHRMKYLLANVPGLRTLWSASLYGLNKFRFRNNRGIEPNDIMNDNYWAPYSAEMYNIN